MKTIFLIALLVLTITSCQRGCASLDKQVQFSDRDYTIVMYSGGDTVFYDQFRGILNDNEHSDGVYYSKNGVLVEVSGDYVVTSKN